MNEPFDLHHLQIQLFYIFQKIGDQEIIRALWFTDNSTLGEKIDQTICT